VATADRAYVDANNLRADVRYLIVYGFQ
jgi:hypothetical protein